MATTFDWYPYGGQYDNADASVHWLDAISHFYFHKNYNNRIYYKLGSAGGWTNNGKRIRITSAVWRVYRNDAGTFTGWGQVYREGSSVSASNSLSGGTATKSFYAPYSFCEDLSNYINETSSSSVTFYLNGTSSGSTYVRICGYNNTSYESKRRPYFHITWEYANSLGHLDNSQYNYGNPVTLLIEPNTSTDYHKVEWYINNETTPYYTQNLTAGSLVSNCSYFGAAPSGATLNSATYFTTVDTVPAKVVLTTYDNTGFDLGSKEYTFSLVKPTGASTALLSKTSYQYNETVSVTISPVSTACSHVLKWYARDTMVKQENIAASASSSITKTYTYFGTLNYDTYFHELTTSCPAKIVLETYDDQGDFMGSRTYNFTLKDTTKTFTTTSLSVDPVIFTDSIIVIDPIALEQTLVSDLFTTWEQVLMNKLHPVGSIYISATATNPSARLGGTWVPYSPARTLMSTTAFASIGETGGSFTHTLTETEMPSHNHQLTFTAKVNYYAGTNSYEDGDASSGNGAYISPCGGGEAHNNTQPYEICYMWLRTA